ncbi:MAG: type II toxin-antitoxin system prevent-host-death family antitoxin [Candidatus Aminicenantes bacterium]|nr:MAG: type II toxin-antitoxin system prevent-host-death family antitoxin [Candidatus Aminicenantes bacterium]
MKSVGIRELKTHLSQYLNLVKNGEIVVVTNHNKIIAEIRQPSEIEMEYGSKKQKIEAYLDKLKSENKIRRANRSFSLVDTLKPTKKVPTDKWKAIYQKIREDRF